MGAALLTACGGGGDGDGDISAQRAAGVWTGTTDTNRNVTALTLSDGRYYVIYDRVGTPGTTGGLIAGTGENFLAANYASANAIDYGFEALPGPVDAATVVGSLEPGQSFNAASTHRSNGTGFVFNTTFDTDFYTVPTLATIAGAYTGTVTFSLGARPNATFPAPVVFNVDANGAVTSDINGCLITGQLAPRSDGNIYDLSITFGGGLCAYPGQTFTGVGYYRAATRELRTATTAPAATYNPAIGLGTTPQAQGVVFVGTKP
jgi:hypothetical protein